MKRNIITLIFFILISSRLYAQTEKLTSRFYFPALIGLGVPLDNDNTTLKKGFILNTAVEYRPTYINAVFFRFNYDALSTNYSSTPANLPTNVIEGKVSTSFFLIGAGYRQKVKKLGIYGLVQEGIGSRSFSNAIITKRGITIKNISTSSFTLKGALGIEYYIVPHFALIAEPSFYKLISNRGFNNFHSQVLGINIGFTTTLF